MAFRPSPELDHLLEKLLGSEKQKLYDQIGLKLPHHIRFNPLKGDVRAQQEFFRQQGFDFEPIPEIDDVYRITYQPYPIGKSLAHYLGHIYVQDIASMLPALALNPQPGDWVLDMSAAPGSKTTLMGALMENQGVILANDVVSKRLKALGKNLERMSIINTTVYKWFGEQFGNTYFEQFDKVLLDPACSGLGTLHKNPEILGWWTPKHCERLASSQKNLLISAVKSLRPGGELLYSTCTLTPEENEAIVDFALQNLPMEMLPVDLGNIPTWPGLTEFDGQHFHPDCEKAVRLYPFERITEGFFIARLRKTGPSKTPPPEKRKEPRRLPYLRYKTSPVKKYLQHLADDFDLPFEVFRNYAYLIHKEIAFTDISMTEFPIYGNPLQIGVPLARMMDYGAKLNTGGCHLIGQHARRKVIELEDLPTVEKFVNRQPLDIPVDEKGQYIVKYNGLVLGYGLSDKGSLKSQFPKGEWPFDLTSDWKGKTAGPK